MANELKLNAAVALLIARTQPGKLKLLKLLYLADFTAHWELGSSITGDLYEHWRHGPVPKHLWANFDAVVGLCATVERVVSEGSPFAEPRLIPTGKPDLSSLSPAELAILDRIVREHGAMTGKELRTILHDSVPYRATSHGEEIPYYLAPYRRTRVNGNGAAPIAGVEVTDSLQRAVAKIMARSKHVSG